MSEKEDALVCDRCGKFSIRRDRWKIPVEGEFDDLTLCPDCVEILKGPVNEAS